MELIEFSGRKSPILQEPVSAPERNKWESTARKSLEKQLAVPPCKLQERGFWVLEKFHLGTSILSQSSVIWEIPVGLQTPSVRATLQELPLDLPLIIEATTTLTFSDRFALPRRKQLEDDPCRMDYHVPQVPPLYMPEPEGSITFQLRPAQEQQVLLPSQTTLCKVTPGHTGNRASSASAPIGISPRGSTQHLVTISSWKQAPELPSLHAWRCIGSCPHPAPALRHLPRRRRPSRRLCPRGSSHWWLCAG